MALTVHGAIEDSLLYKNLILMSPKFVWQIECTNIIFAGCMVYTYTY